MNNQQGQSSDKAMLDQVAIDEYTEELIKERKDPSVTDANREQVKSMLVRELDLAINRQLVNLLSEKDQLALDDMLARNATNLEVDQFLMEKIPNIEAEIASVLLNFRAAYLYDLEQGKTLGIVEPQNENAMSPTPTISEPPSLIPAPLKE